MSQRSAFFLPVTARAQGNALAAQLGIDPEALLNTLSVPLVPASGPADAEPTHYGCCGRLTEAQRSALEQASGLFPDARWWRWAEVLAASWDGRNIGEHWSWEKSLARAGLQVQASSQFL